MTIVPYAPGDCIIHLKSQLVNIGTTIKPKNICFKDGFSALKSGINNMRALTLGKLDFPAKNLLLGDVTRLRPLAKVGKFSWLKTDYSAQG